MLLLTGFQELFCMYTVPQTILHGQCKVCLKRQLDSMVYPLELDVTMGYKTRVWQL